MKGKRGVHFGLLEVSLVFLVLFMLLDSTPIQVFGLASVESHQTNLSQILSEISRPPNRDDDAAANSRALAPQQSDPAAPLFAFDGAYTDTGFFAENETTRFYTLEASISDVNSAQGTFLVTEGESFNFLGLNNSFSYNYSQTASFDNPSPFPAYGSYDLSLLNQGEAPPDVDASEILTSQVVVVPAGTFNTDMIQLRAINASESGLVQYTSNSVLWVDSFSGILVKSSSVYLTSEPSTPGVNSTYSSSFTMELDSTNVPMSSSSSTSSSSTSSTSTSCPNPNVPSSGQLAFLDNFANDGANPKFDSPNTVLWSVNSAVLSQIASAESTAFGENVGIGGLIMPVGYASCGINWSVEGDQMLSGLTTQAAFTPPFSAQVVATPNPPNLPGRAGGNPTAIFLSNSDASVLIAVYIGTSQICVQSAGSSPTCGSQVNVNEQYSVEFDVTESQVTVTVQGSEGESPYVVTNQVSGNDLALYLSIGTFAGEVPGETSYPTYSDSSTFASASVWSTTSRSMTVTVDTSFSGSANPSQGAFVNATDSILHKSYTGYTDSSGEVTFSGIVTGTYIVTASQSESSLGTFSNSEAVVVGDPADPDNPEYTTTLVISVPPISPLTLSIATTSPAESADEEVSGLSPLVANFVAAPFGWTGSYDVTWSVDGQQQPSSSADGLAFTYDFVGSSAVQTFTVQATVTSSGSWFGVTQKTTQTTSDPIKVAVINDPYFANIISVGSNNQISFLADSSGYQGEVLFDGQNVLLSGQIVNDPAGITIPSWLQGLLGVSTPYYAIDLSDTAGTQTSHELIQLDTTAQLQKARLPAGTPLTTAGLTGYNFAVTLDPKANWAILYDVVAIILAATGVLGGIPTSDAPSVMDAVVSSVSSYGSSLSADLASNSVEMASELVKLLTSIIWALASSVPLILTHFGLDTIGKAFAEKVLLPIMVAQLTYDIVTLAGAIVIGDYSEEFSINTLVSSLEVNVDPNGPLPFVTLSGGTGVNGYTGTWVGDPVAFDHSSVVNGTYAFAVPSGSYTLTVTAPPGVTQTDYNVGINASGVVDTVSGIVKAGSPVTYTVTPSSNGVKVTTTTSSTGSGGIPEFPYQLGLAALVTSVVVVAYLLTRRSASKRGLENVVSNKKQISVRNSKVEQARKDQWRYSKHSFAIAFSTLMERDLITGQGHKAV